MDIDKLISEVFIRSPLWDQKNPNHCNRSVSDKLRYEVAIELNTRKHKWYSLIVLIRIFRNAQF